MIRTGEARNDRLFDHIRDFIARRAVEIIGLLLLLLTAAAATALLTWTIGDPSLNHVTSAPVRNFLGVPGAIGADLLMQLFGLASGIVLIPLGIASLRMMSSGHFHRPKLRVFLLVTGLVVLAGFISLFPTTQRWPLPTGLGGFVGDSLSDALMSVLPADWPKKPVAGLLCLLASLMSLLLVAGVGLGHYEDELATETQRNQQWIDDLKDDDREPEGSVFSVLLGSILHAYYSTKAACLRPFQRKSEEAWTHTHPAERARIEPGFNFPAQGQATTDDHFPDAEQAEALSVVQTARQKRFEFAVEDEAAPQASKRKAAPAKAQKSLRGAVDETGYEMPSLSLLTEAKRSLVPLMPPEVLEQNARLLENVLDDFGVRGEIVNVRPGPVVTLYELEPAPGIKSSRVVGLADDIARSMSAISARVAVVPGRNAIGIELPNQKRETVYLSEMLASDAFSQTDMKLALCLGKNIGGDPVIAELARMPHVLVAGTTGSGKSVAINTMILSLLYRLKPEQCRLIMVDPKMLELSVYDGIPHLLTPVVTDPKKAVLALKWAVREMEERYKKMAKLGVRNIDGFNTRISEARAKGEQINRTVQTGFDRETGEAIYETETMSLESLPYIVVIVDEMADLMMVAGKDIEGAVQRLAQMARAAGIHVILATQRPSVDVITGTIKANFPTRISFQVTSKIDSRTILGEQGAEQLLGQGDMLYMMGGGRISRVHGPFVSDAEVERVVAHLKSQGQPHYLDAVTEDDGSEEADQAVFDQGQFGAAGTDLYDQAVALVLRDRKASTSYIQRRLQIGYNRAATLMERMENEGIVGPANHAGKREILLEGGHRGHED
jgi:S-DNA-T family DNA segregation ATPase FtsK/SpoIIIE